MRFLIDNSVSWRVGRDLRKAGHDPVHVGDVGMARTADQLVYRAAVEQRRVVIAQDSDFGPIHAAASDRTGVIHLKLSDGRPRIQAEVLLANLSDIERDLLENAFVIVDDDRIRIHRVAS